MGRVLHARSARNDLLEAWLYIAKDDPAAADRVLDAIEQEGNTLSLQPLMGRLRPELWRGVRSWPTSNAHVLFYPAGKKGITVLQVLHHARDVQRIVF